MTLVQLMMTEHLKMAQFDFVGIKYSIAFSRRFGDALHKRGWRKKQVTVKWFMDNNPTTSAYYWVQMDKIAQRKHHETNQFSKSIGE